MMHYLGTEPTEALVHNGPCALVHNGPCALVHNGPCALVHNGPCALVHNGYEPGHEQPLAAQVGAV
jgi:hypothetical protein